MEVPKKVKYFCFDLDFEPRWVEVELRDAGYDGPFMPAHVPYKRGWDILAAMSWKNMTCGSGT